MQIETHRAFFRARRGLEKLTRDITSREFDLSPRRTVASRFVINVNEWSVYDFQSGLSLVAPRPALSLNFSSRGKGCRTTAFPFTQ